MCMSKRNGKPAVPGHKSNGLTLGTALERCPIAMRVSKRSGEPAFPGADARECRGFRLLPVLIPLCGETQFGIGRGGRFRRRLFELRIPILRAVCPPRLRMKGGSGLSVLSIQGGGIGPATQKSRHFVLFAQVMQVLQ